MDRQGLSRIGGACVGLSLSLTGSAQIDCFQTLSTFEIPGVNFGDVDVKGDIAHIAALGEYISVDVSNPFSPVLIDRLALPNFNRFGPIAGFFNRVRVLDTIAIVARGNQDNDEGGLHIILTDGEGVTLDRITFD